MQLIKYFVTIFTAVFLIVWAASWVTNKGLRRSHVDFYVTMNAASDTSKQTNFAIFGSSRALVHLDTRVIDSTTGLHSYNYGLNGASIKTCFNTMLYALQFQKHLKLAMLNIDLNFFEVSSDPYKDAYYYPFEKKISGFLMNDTTNSRLIHKLKFFDISLYDDYTKYAAIDGWLRPQRPVDGNYNGYTPQNTVYDFKVLTINSSERKPIEVYDSSFKQLNDIIVMCKSKGIQLAFVIAPYYKECFPDKYYTNYYELMQKTRQIARQNDVIFLDYSAIPLSSDKSSFYNGNHMNSKGARIYTLIVADTINNFLKSGKFPK